MIDLFLCTAWIIAYAIPQYPEGDPVFKSWDSYIHFFGSLKFHEFNESNEKTVCANSVTVWGLVGLWKGPGQFVKEILWKRSIAVRL